MPDRQALPALVVPEEGYRLLRDFMRHYDIQSISEVARVLMAESPRLIAFAKERDRQICLTVGKQGGYRERKKKPE
mgnify:FL=1